MSSDPKLPFATVSDPRDTSSSQAVPVPASTDNDNSIEALIRKSIAWQEAIYLQNKKIQRRLTWMAVGSYLKLLIIFIPLMIGIFYIPKLMEQLFHTLNTSGNPDIQAMFQEMMQLYSNPK